MFNLSGSEIVFLLIIGLVVLGPEKLPTALRKAGRLYGEFRRITSGAESDFRSAFAEPIREMQETATSYKRMFTNAAGEITDAVTKLPTTNPSGDLPIETPAPVNVVSPDVIPDIVPDVSPDVVPDISPKNVVD